MVLGVPGDLVSYLSIQMAGIIAGVVVPAVTHARPPRPDRRPPAGAGARAHRPRLRPALLGGGPPDARDRAGVRDPAGLDPGHVPGPRRVSRRPARPRAGRPLMGLVGR